MNKRRIGIEGAGFINQQLIDQIRFSGIERDFIDAVLSIFEFSNDFIVNSPVYTPYDTPQEKQRVMSVILLVRLKEITEAIFILSAYGVRQELRSLFRVFLDAYFLVANVCRDPDFSIEYLRSDDVDRARLMNAASRHDSPLFERLKEYATVERRSQIKEKIKQQNIRKLGSEEHAKKANLAEIYDSMYRTASASVHTSPKCLEDYAENGSDGYISKILHRGDAETVRNVLYDTVWFFLTANENVAEIFSPGQLENRVAQLRTNLERSLGRVV